MDGIGLSEPGEVARRVGAMLSRKKRDASDKAALKDVSQRVSYKHLPRTSSGILKEQLSTLLLALQGPMTRGQRATGWQVFEALLSARYGERSV